MPKIRSGPSKRMSSRQRHKIDRKKREHKRDLRKAAKAMKNSGLGPKRTKKTRELAKLALKVSNAHPDKEAILQRVLQVREDARVQRAKNNHESGHNDDSDNNDECYNIGSPCEETHTPSPLSQTKKVITYISIHESNNFSYQFKKTLRELVFPPPRSLMELPSVSYMVTLDARCAVQCMPWGLLDAIVRESATYERDGGSRKVLILFVFTKIDLVSVPALVSQISLVAHAIVERYIDEAGVGDVEGDSLRLNDTICVAFCPVSNHFEKTTRHLLRILRQFLLSESCVQSNRWCNLEGKHSSFVIGLPNTGRRTLCRAFLREGGDSNVSIGPVSAAEVQLMAKKGANPDDVDVNLTFPNAKQITLLQFPEDRVLMRELAYPTGGDIIFKPLTFVERLTDPEVIGCMLFNAALDKVSLAQGFCQPAEDLGNTSTGRKSIMMSERFFRCLGNTVRREKGFFVSPLFVSCAGTMGKISSSSLTASADFTSRQESAQANLLDASYSNATPNKLVRISSVVAESRGRKKSTMKVKRVDSHNALKLGARTFVREFCQGKNIPWAVMRPPKGLCLTKSMVENASLVFDLSLCCGMKLGAHEAKRSPAEHLAALLNNVASLLKQYLVFMPNNVVEFDPDSIIAPFHSLGAIEMNNDNDEEASINEDDYADEEEYDDDEDDEEESD